MISDRSRDVATRAKKFYEDELRSHLEATDMDRYVAIEPDSKDYFLGNSYTEAVMAARQSHSDRISFVVHIGHEAAIHLGGVAW